MGCERAGLALAIALDCAVGLERQVNEPMRGGHYTVRAALCITFSICKVGDCGF